MQLAREMGMAVLAEAEAGPVILPRFTAAEGALL
jgi:hypothetical protein